jgi:uncharacterized protein
MAGSSLLTLLDDIATILDDVAILTKVAAKKTAGVLGDDLALNADQVSGVPPNRELPVVWAVAKGSAINKVILVPVALVISWLAPWAIIPLLMAGGAFLCYEGCEKLAHKLFPPKEEVVEHAARLQALADPAVDIVAFEKQQIKGAIRTDFILSAEIIVITLGTLAQTTLDRRVLVLTTVAVLMTVGVYGLVAAIVKLDDLGLALSKRTGALRAIGRGILFVAPYLMKSLSILGTAAMFLVGGDILTHGIPPLHHFLESLPWLAGTAAGAGIGIVAGAVILGIVTLIKKAVRAR